ncbi:phosphoglycerate mutase family protein [Roseivirga sp.]|uniref:SixA phosphatase family protein n=1 Tax=Roseivirga sp. TaxID=1964215 RepID=UPI002B272941|nr:phosphoglycerate mutase family protein [Roseivirga sp.]
MKNFLFVALFSFCFLGCTPQPAEVVEVPSTTFILVRHAEKGTDDPRNPSLNEEGILRAEKLLNMLSSAEVGAIYSSPYKRTRETVAPLASQLGLEIQEYNPSENTFADEALKSYQGKTILVSGHSNTVPGLANYLLGEDKFKQLDESEYSKIFIVTVDTVGKARVMVLNY